MMHGSVKAWIGHVFWFLRIPMIGFSLGPAIVGAATGKSDVRVSTVCEIAILALFFHIPIMLVNDIIDLKIDRCDPLRARSPLVLGLITVKAAWLIAGTSFAVMMLLVFALFPGPWLAISLLIGVCAVTVYNVWGKACRFPIATDFIQSVGWSALGYFGALAAGGAGKQTYFLCAALVFFTMLVNAYGSLRDIRADGLASGFTTVMLLGAWMSREGPVITSRLAVYFVSLYSVLLGISLSALLTSHGTPKIASCVSLCLFLVSLAISSRAFRGVRSESHLYVLGAASITVGFAGVAALSATAHYSFVPALAFAVFLLPMCVNPAFRNMVRVKGYV